MSKFTELLNDPFAIHKYIVICEPIVSVVSGTDISVTGGNTINSVSTVFDYAVGGKVAISGSPIADNNNTFTVVSSTAHTIVVSETITDHSAGDKIGIGKVDRVYFSSGKFVTNTSTTPPTGAPMIPAHIAFEARLDRALYFERSIYSSGAIGGNSIPGFGTVEVLNMDGYLDGFNSYIWTRRPVWVLLGGSKFSYSEHGMIFAGVTEDVEVDDERVVIQMRDLKALFDVAIQPKTFSGSGSYEGDLELKDKVKPKCYGRCYNIEPVEVGKIGGYRTWVFNDGPVAAYDSSFHQVFDRGVALTYTTSTTPGSSEWTLDPVNAAIIVGGKPDGPVTANVKGDASGAVYVENIADILTRIVTTCPSDEPTLLSNDIDIDNINVFKAYVLGSTTLGAVQVGLYINESMTVADALDKLMISVGGFYGFTRDGQFNIGRFTEPSDQADFEIAKAEILDLTKETTAPATSSLELIYAPVWTVLSDSDIAASSRTNIVTNGDFDDTTGWTIPAGWSISGGRATATSASTALLRSVTPVAGLEYRMTIDISRSGGSLQPKIGNINLGSAISSSGTFTHIFQSSTGNAVDVSLVGTGFSGYVESFEIQPTLYWFFTEKGKTIKIKDGSLFSSEEDTVNTLLINDADAQAEAERQFALYSVKRNVYSVRCKIQPFALDVGDTVKITYHRWGLNAGKNLVVLEVKEDCWYNEVTLTLWG